MNFPVYSAAMNPAIDSPLYHKPWGYLKQMIDAKPPKACQVNMFEKKAGVQLLAPAPTRRQIEDLGLSEAVTILSRRGGLIPFVRVQNPLCDPDGVSYPIPACGAHTRMLRVTQVNYVPAVPVVEEAIA